MPDLSTRVAAVRPHLHGRWTSQREQRAWNAVSSRMRSRRQPAVALALAFAAVAAVAVGLWRWSAPGTPSAEVVAAAGAQMLVDGSSIRTLTPEARLDTLEDGPGGTRVRLREGSARFEVSPRASRPFVVLARGVTVEVVGTAFRVALEARGVRVVVERGRVRVRAPQAVGDVLRELGAGEQALFEPPAASAAAPSAAPAPSAAVPEPSAAPTRSWRSAAQDGDYRTALKLLETEGPGAVRDDPQDLLLASDAARLGGRPDRAVRWLEQVGKRHGSSSLAPLAAFTLGRVLLEQLGRPSEAAQAFARAQRLAPGGALAEDALAREVECWARAGDASLARERAGDYERQFPKGRRLRAVRAHAGLDDSVGEETR